MPEYVRNIQLLASRVGRSYRSLHVYAREGCPLERTDQGYEVDAVREWIAKHRPSDDELEAREMGGDDEEGDEDPSAPAERPETPTRRARLRKLEAEAEKKELEVERARLLLEAERGRLLPREEVEERRLRMIGVVRQELLRLPAALAPLLANRKPADVRRLLDERVDELLRRFAEM